MLDENPSSLEMTVSRLSPPGYIRASLTAAVYHILRRPYLQDSSASISRRPTVAAQLSNSTKGNVRD
jgi:hypothetical protein